MYGMIQKREKTVEKGRPVEKWNDYLKCWCEVKSLYGKELYTALEKGTTQSGNYGEVIGWEKSDTSPFFYMKFHEWGTTMHKPKKFMLEAARPTYQALKSIAEEEYEKVLKEKLEG